MVRPTWGYHATHVTCLDGAYFRGVFANRHVANEVDGVLHGAALRLILPSKLLETFLL